MRRALLCVVLMLGSFLFFSCEDDGYVYPSVQLEFLTAQTGGDGRIQSVVTDEGVQLPLEKDHTRSQFNANSAVRIVANYELLPGEGTQKEVRIYTLLKAVAADPQPADKFTGGVKTDPTDVQSIWMGCDYLNLVAAVQAQSGTHRFGFIEESVEIGADGLPIVRLLLYHDAGGDVEAYTKRGYLSVSLKNKYPQGAHLTFRVNTYDTLKTYHFDYKPSDN